MDKEIFEKIKKEAIEKVTQKYLGQNPDPDQKIAPSSLLEHLLNLFMLSERDLFLSKNSDMANGFYERELKTTLGTLDLPVPRTRNLKFRPLILPERWRRTDEHYGTLLFYYKWLF